MRSIRGIGLAPRYQLERIGGRARLSEEDLAALADGAEAAGNPVIGLVQLLRERLSSEPARWVHRGLTSQVRTSSTRH